MRGWLLAHLRAPRAVLWGAVLVSGVLLASTLFIQHTIREASHFIARGLGETLVSAGQQRLADTEPPLEQASLEALLEAHREDGLRYVAVFPRDGTPLAAAGTPLGHTLEEGELELSGDRARLVQGLRLPPHLGRLLARDEAPLLPGMELDMVEPDLFRAGGPRRRRPPLRLVVEFEPLAALALARQSRTLLAVALVSCVGILLLAFAFSRALAQRELLQAELERGRRLAALGSMSAVLAHELRNPLASLKGHAQLLAETVERDIRLSPRATRVVSEAVRLERLMNDLLAFVRGGELRRLPVEPNEVLRAAVAAVGGEAVDVHYLTGSERWLLDAERLQQALENVLRNALQASAGGQRVEARVESAGRNLDFIVRDAGPGIPPGDEERIFEPFVTGRVRGIGLGLAITRRIVELHGGRVRASNQTGGGAELRITLPGKES